MKTKPKRPKPQTRSLYFGKRKRLLHGYPSIQYYAVEKTRHYMVHRLVWEQAHGEIPDGLEVHHIDFNKANFALENLELLTRSAHRRKHLWAEHIDQVDAFKERPCLRCNRVLPFADFYERTDRVGYGSYCRACKKARKTAMKQRKQFFRMLKPRRKPSPGQLPLTLK